MSALIHFFIPETPTSRIPKGSPEPSREPTEAPTQQPKATKKPTEAPTQQPRSPNDPTEASTQQTKATKKPTETPTQQPRSPNDPTKAPTQRPKAIKKPQETPTQQLKATKKPPEASTQQPKPTNEPTKATTQQTNPGTGSSDILMKLLVVALFGIIVVVLLAVVVLLFLFFPKYRKRNADVREQNEYPMNCDARMTTIGLHPPNKMNSNFALPLLPSLEVTDEGEVSVRSSGTHSLDLSEHKYSYIYLTDTMKRKMLQDPNVTAESKEKIKNELAENEKLLKNSERVLVPTCKMNSHFPSPLLPSLEITDERGVSVSSSGTHSLDLSEHRYSYIYLTDTMKRKMLQDPNVTAESKEKVQKELAEKEKLLRKYEKVSAAENEEVGKLMAEFDHLYERK